MQYLLDTSICVFFLRGKFKLDEVIKQAGVQNCFLSEITVFELKFGAENSANPSKSKEAVDRFINGITIIPIYGIVDKYAETKVYLRKKGVPMHDEFDLLIGVTALVNKLTLVTDNVKDFKNIKNLKIENWISNK